MLQVFYPTGGSDTSVLRLVNDLDFHPLYQLGDSLSLSTI